MSNPGAGPSSPGHGPSFPSHGPWDPPATPPPPPPPPPSTLQVPLAKRRVLDEQMARSRRFDTRPWGVWPWLGPVLFLVASIVGGQVLTQDVDPTGWSTGRRLVVGLAFNLVPELLLVAVCLAFARPIARREDGWRVAFGWGWISRQDWAPYGLGLAVVFVGRIVIGQISTGLTHGRAAEQARNLVLTHRPSALGIVVLFLAVAVIAPVAEELMFRGLLLRTFLRRWGFWPAAAVSTAMFALFHVYEVHTVLGAVFLAAGIAVLGGVNCYLVRITGRLAPGMLVHATFNLLALLVLIAQTKP